MVCGSPSDIIEFRGESRVTNGKRVGQYWGIDPSAVMTRRLQGHHVSITTTTELIGCFSGRSSPARALSAESSNVSSLVMKVTAGG